MMQWLSRPVVSEVKMLRIGEFSRLSQVTIKALRYYDDMGLLKPAEIDHFTGYRYYTVEQLPRIHRIIALKELGLSLEQIGVMLNDDLSPDQIREVLQMQQAEIKQRIQEEQSRLAQVEFRLRMIDMENEMPNLDVIVKSVPAFRALTLRLSLHGDSACVREQLVDFGMELDHALEQHSIKLAGPVMEIRYAEEFLTDFQDVEIVLPVDEQVTSEIPLETAGILKLRTIHTMMAATYVHRSTDPTGQDFSHIPEAMSILRRWIVDNGYKMLGTHRNVHHHGPLEHAEYEDWITEFQHEIAFSS